jgi:hypothetical protein
MNCASTCGSQPAASEGSSATAMAARQLGGVAHGLGARSSPAMLGRALTDSKRSPSCVSSTWRVLRSNRRRPTLSSSALMSALNAGCDRWQRRRAGEVLHLGQRQKGLDVARRKIHLHSNQFISIIDFTAYAASYSGQQEIP